MRHKLGFFSGGIREHGDENWLFMKGEKFLDYQNAPQRGACCTEFEKYWM
jgi:hypothetical protein